MKQETIKSLISELETILTEKPCDNCYSLLDLAKLVVEDRSEIGKNEGRIINKKIFQIYGIVKKYGSAEAAPKKKEKS